MFNFRKRKQPDVLELTPMERLEAACDEMNAAIRAMPVEHRRIRPYTVTGIQINNGRPCVILGYWANARFNQIYSSDGYLEI